MRDGSLDAAPICTDITKLDGKPWRGAVDLICGGFPCQDISIAGKRAGINGERSGLWSEFARIICEIRPRFTIVENVAGLLRSGMGRVLGDLAGMGYDSEWAIISAAAVGAPHLRERVWIVADADGFGRCTKIGTEPGHSAHDSIRLQREISECGRFHIESRFDSLTQGSSTNPEGERFSEGRELQCGRSEERISSGPQEGVPSDIGKERAQRIFAGTLSWVREFSWCENVRRVEDLAGRSDIPQPLIRGTRDGIPHWVDRVAALGNAVVPQIVEWIGRQIKAVNCPGK